jgi:hypothetical protein
MGLFGKKPVDKVQTSSLESELNHCIMDAEAWHEDSFQKESMIIYSGDINFYLGMASLRAKEALEILRKMPQDYNGERDLHIEEIHIEKLLNYCQSELAKRRKILTEL